jgi:hypothetical protein
MMKWLFLLFVSVAHAEEWPSTDKWMLGAAVTLMVIDWGQTRDMTRHPWYKTHCPTCKDPYYEHNPLLGKTPSIGEVDKYFTAAILGTLGIAYVMPNKYRPYFLGGVVSLQSYWVYNNHRIGLRVDF